MDYPECRELLLKELIKTEKKMGAVEPELEMASVPRH